MAFRADPLLTEHVQAIARGPDGLVLLDPIHDRVERLYRHDPDDPHSLAHGTPDCCGRLSSSNRPIAPSPTSGRPSGTTTRPISPAASSDASG